MSKNKPNRQKQRIKEGEKLKDILAQLDEASLEAPYVRPIPVKEYAIKVRVVKYDNKGSKE